MTRYFVVDTASNERRGDFADFDNAQALADALNATTGQARSWSCVVKRVESSTRIADAQRSLDDACLNVQRAASEAESALTYAVRVLPLDSEYRDDLQEILNALSAWKEATAHFRKVAQHESEHGSVTRVTDVQEQGR